MTLAVRSSVTVPDAARACVSHGDGHRIHDIRVRRALRDRDLAVRALVTIVDETTVLLSWDGAQFAFRHHDVGAIADALAVGGDIAEWVPRWRVLVVPGRTPGSAVAFTLSAPEHWAACTAC
ncbi:MAG: hypothetical protein GXY65_16755 [Rhodococcus sp.]|uniref:hypothetical protein n=1 Tax=Rhodococcus TaxID=1827 RepID=UPI0016A429F5|nr:MULTISPECIES: hypothetical protein [Rhodococcus]NLV80956.1 hypothetical protein [Rhodococcus sp. (in: high G+C Gram-positive bacteria)]